MDASLSAALIPRWYHFISAPDILPNEFETDGSDIQRLPDIGFLHGRADKPVVMRMKKDPPPGRLPTEKPVGFKKRIIGKCHIWHRRRSCHTDFDSLRACR